MFTNTQRREFKRNGFLVLPEAIDEDVVRAARDEIRNDDVPKDGEELATMAEADPESLDLAVEDRRVQLRPGNGGIFIGDAAGEEPWLTINEQVFEYAEALVGEDRLAPPTDRTVITIRYPSEESFLDPSAQQPSDLGTHIDGIGVDGRMLTIAAAIFVDDVQPRGGGTTVWPGSHWHTGAFYEDHDLEEADGGLPARTADGWDEERKLSDQFDPVEVSGPAGTVMMWHGHLVHSGGVNLRPGRPRIALFTRFFLREEYYDEEASGPRPFREWPAMESVDIADLDRAI